MRAVIDTLIGQGMRFEVCPEYVEAVWDGAGPLEDACAPEGVPLQAYLGVRPESRWD